MCALSAIHLAAHHTLCILHGNAAFGLGDPDDKRDNAREDGHDGEDDDDADEHAAFLVVAADDIHHAMTRKDHGR